MRIIKKKTVVGFGEKYPDSRKALAAWLQVASAAEWNSLADVRRDFPSADGVEVESERIVTGFSIRGKRYRLITAIHYPAKTVYTMRFMTHAEYSKDIWKETL